MMHVTPEMIAAANAVVPALKAATVRQMLEAAMLGKYVCTQAEGGAQESIVDTIVDLAMDPQEAFNVLRPAAPGLFQIRKCGVIVAVPQVVRDGMLAKFGAEAQKVLDLLDGNVERYMVKSEILTNS